MSKPVAIITGASRGIGFSVAQALLEKEYAVVITARHQSGLDDAKAALLAKVPQGEVLAVTGSVADKAHVQDVVKQCQTRWGRVDVLVNNAGISPQIGLLQEMSLESIESIVDTNLKAPLFWMKEVIPVMVNQSAGAIFNISSVAGKTAYPFWSVYCATKFGLTAASESVKEEQRQNGIRVMVIHPGAVDTPLWAEIEPGLTLHRENMLSADDVTQAILYALHQPAHVLIDDIQLSPLKPAL